ncbi:MAG: T9SS type A sorting domain-containing protein, partial [candidate division Zixibacteria bacterium]|nr:T9SS type A sorting domain-containing protein [candidate division Zixibacteria bacterium]
QSSVTRGHHLSECRELIDTHDVDLLVANTKNEDQLANRYIVSGPEIRFTWASAESDIEYYNIYRHDTARYAQYFTTSGIYRSIDPCESRLAEVICDSLIDSTGGIPYLCAVKLTPHSVNSAENATYAEMIDSAAIYYFRITAVDSAGNESAPTGMFSAYTYPTVRKPLAIVLYDSTSNRPVKNFYPDSVYSFYASQFDQFSPDFVLQVPSFLSTGWPPDFTRMGNYQTILLDVTARYELIGLHWELRSGIHPWIQHYIRSNGTIIFVGSGWDSRNELRTPGLTRVGYSRRSIASEIFGLDSSLLISPASHDPVYESDSLYLYFNPIGADPEQSSEFPTIDYHHSNFYAPSIFSVSSFNEGPLPFKGVMFPRPDNTEVLYTYRSGRDTVSQLHGLPVGIKYTPETHTAYTFFMEPWEMEPQQAQALFAALLGDIQTDVSEDSEAALPRVFSLAQNFPNPFNPSTEIHFSTPARSHITLTVYNILGQKVATLVDEIKSAGAYSVQWDASRHASGIYFYQLQSGETKINKKALLLK